MITDQLVLQRVSIEDDHAALHKVVSHPLKRVVNHAMFALRRESNQVARVVVGLDSVDVVDDLARFGCDDDAMQRLIGFAARDYVTSPVDACGASFRATFVRVQRVAPQLPLLPMLGAQAARDGSLVAMRAGRLRRPTSQAVGTVPVALVVLQAHALGSHSSVAALNYAQFHHSCHFTRTPKRFEQIGNAVPCLLAAHVVAAATGLPLLAAQPEQAAA